MNTLIVGSGIAGVTCAEALAKAGHGVTLVTRETAGYYSRPWLSHGFSHEDIEQRIIVRSFDAIAKEGIVVHAGCEVIAIDRAGRRLTCRGHVGEFALSYDKLVLACGSEAFIPPPLLPSRPHFHVLNCLDDLITLRRLREGALAQGRRPRWALIGGGLIGCEMASDLAKVGDRVTLFHAVDRLMERQLEEDDSAALLAVFQAQGIEVELEADIRAVSERNGRRLLETSRGIRDDFDCALVACGFKPRIGLVKETGLETQRGICVDGFLRTADPAIHALGDVAQCADGRVYAFIAPIRHQAQWLAAYLSGSVQTAWSPPAFHPKAKVHGFTAMHPYRV